MNTSLNLQLPGLRKAGGLRQGAGKRMSNERQFCSHRSSSLHRFTRRELGTLSFYEKHAENFCKSTGRLNLNTLSHPFLNELPPHAHILDAGCGSGRDAKFFKSKGYEVTAMDASPKMARLATEHLGQKCLQMPFEEIDFKEQFNGIWASASLLHVSRNEIKNILTRFATALKKDGILFVSLKQGTGEKVDNDGRFFSYYHLEEFGEILTRQNQFNLIKSWKTHAPDSSRKRQCWLNFLVRKHIKAS